MHDAPRSRLLAYSTALPVLALTLVLRWWFHAVLGERALYSSIFPAVLLAAYFGGFWPGLVVTIVGAMASNYLLVVPRFTVSFTDAGDILSVILVVLTGTIISALCESMHRSRRQILADQRRRSDEALNETKERFRFLVQNSSDIISLFDAEGTILYQAPSIERLLGHRPEDRIGRNVFRDPMVHPDDLRAKRAFFNAILSRPDAPITAEFRLRHADGSWRDIEGVGQNFLNDPNVAGIVANYRDISQRKRAEEALRQSDERMRQLVSLMPAAIYTCDAEGRITFYNRRAAELWGREPRLGTEDQRFCGSVRLWQMDGSPLPHDQTPIAACIRDGVSTRNTEVVIEQPDGQRVIVSVNIEPLHNLDGTRAGAINVFEDITERKRAEEAMRRQAALLRLSNDAIIVWKLDGGIESWSHGAEELYGFAETEALGRVTHELLRTVHPAPWPEMEAKLRSSGSWEGEIRHRTKDGRELIVSTRHQLLRDADGAWRVLESNRDITARKRDEALLDGQKRILEMIIQGEPLANVLTVLCRTIEELAHGEMLASVLLLDADGVHLRHGAAPSLPESYIRAIDGLAIGANEGSCGTAAYRREPVFVSDIATDPLWTPYAELALSHGLCACWSSPILSSADTVLGTFAMYYRHTRQPTPRDLRVVDIVTRTVAIAIEHSRAEQALRESEERFRSLAKATNDAVWDWELATNKVWWNEGVFTLFGYVVEQNETTPAWWLERLHPDDREAVEAFFFGIVHGRELSWVDEYRFRCADGSYKDVYDRGYVIRDADGKAVRMIGAMLDISARKRAEEALRESEHRWRSLAEALPQFVWTARPDGFMDYGSAQIQRYMGCPESDVLGWGWLQRLHPDDQDRTRQAWQAAVEAQQSEYEIEHRFRRFDGAYRWFKTRGVAVPDSEGSSYKWFGTCTDVTTDKQLEEGLRLAKQAAESANRAKDEFLANVSHEIRTPMNAIMGLTTLVLGTQLDDGQRHSLATVKSAANNLLGIINDLLDFSKIEAGKLELDSSEFSLRTALNDTLRALAVRAHQKGLELVSNVQPDVPDSLIGDAGRLRQVLLNIVGNAIKFTHEGEVVVQVSVASDGALSNDHDDCVELLFTVRDTGVGIPREKHAAIFRAFEQEDSSTTRKYGGTGLGLTISAQLVSLMRGKIAVDSEPGRGSTFSITARFGRSSKRDALASSTTPHDPLENLRVLVVDDNLTNRHILEEWLNSWRMRPSTVGDGAAALNALRHAVELTTPYSLVLLDGRMPDVDGLTLAAQIRERVDVSCTRMILLSSDDSTLNMARSRDVGIGAHLLKPVQQSELLEVIRNVMTRESSATAPTAARASTAEIDPSVSAPASAALRILVAEDNEFNVTLLKELFDRRGHRAHFASDGREALTLATDGAFDLLLLDIHMPEMDGFDVARAIRQQERGERGDGRHLPIIAFTARSGKSDRERCLAAGMDDFLSKPVQADELWAAVDRAAARGRVVAAATTRDKPDENERDGRLLDSAAILRACGGDAAILAKICQALRASMPNQIARVRATLRDNDAAQLREAAHAMYGPVAAFSTVAGAAVSRLEDEAADGHLARCEPMVEQLESICAELLEQTRDLSIASLTSRHN